MVFLCITWNLGWRASNRANGCQFEENQDGEIIVLLTHYNETLGTWSGKAYCTNDSSIIITITHSKEDRGYTHYLFPMWKQANFQTLFIGHMTRVNEKVSTCVTKTVILEMCEEDVIKPNAMKFEINSPDVRKSFSKFLNQSSVQPLKAPPSFIIDHTTFDKWMARNK